MPITTDVTINVSDALTTQLREFADSHDIAQTALYRAICTFKESNPSLGEAFYGSGTGGGDAHMQISQAAKDVLRFPEAQANFAGGASAYRKSIADDPKGGKWQATMSNATIARTWKTGCAHPELLTAGIVKITKPKVKTVDGKEVKVKGKVKVDVEALKEWNGVIDFNAERNDAPTTTEGKDCEQRHNDNLARLADLTKQVKASKSGKWKPGVKNSEGKKIEFAMTADMVLQLGGAILILAEACKEHNEMEAAPVAATG
jgi:hypothetical protein